MKIIITYILANERARSRCNLGTDRKSYRRNLHKISLFCCFLMFSNSNKILTDTLCYVFHMCVCVCVCVGAFRLGLSSTDFFFIRESKTCVTKQIKKNKKTRLTLRKRTIWIVGGPDKGRFFGGLARLRSALLAAGVFCHSLGAFADSVLG